MTAYTFRISLDCPHCRAGVPVNAITEEVLCSNCLRSIELNQEWWETSLDSETIEEALTFEPGNGNSSQRLGGMNEKVESGNRPPRCQSCKAEFPDELLQKSASAHGFDCPGCKQHINVRKATPLVQSLIMEADLLVHEDEIGSGLGKEGTKASEPILVACLACGASLSVDGTIRTPKCTHCNSSNYLPDPLWLRMHPAVVSHAFFVTRNVEAKPPVVSADKIPDNISSEKALRMLKDENLEPAVLRRLYDLLTEEDDVLEAIAKHKRTTDDLLLKLVDSDHYYQVRVQVAKRPNLSVTIIEKLAEDSDSDVKEALTKRPGLYKLPQHILEDVLRGTDLDELGKSIQDPDFPEWKLYDLADNCDPDSAKRILKARNVSLRVLRRLGSNPESRPFIKEHPQYKAASWWVKLFFFGGG